MVYGEAFIPTLRGAEFGADATAISPMFGQRHERGDGTVSNEIDWVRTSATHREWLPSPELEGQVLAGLEAAVAKGWVEETLVPVHRDSAAYHCIWRRSGTAWPAAAEVAKAL